MLTLTPYDSTNELASTTIQGLLQGLGGTFYEQYGASTALANSVTETSVLNNTSTTTFNAGVYNIQPAVASTLTLPPGTLLSLGTVFGGKLRGTIANTGTPTLRTRLFLTSLAGAATAIADTTAVAMTTTAATDYEIGFEFTVRANGTAGTIIGWIYHRYNATTVYASRTVSTSFDTTLGYTIDVRNTWGAASASNTLTVDYAYLGVIG